MKSTDVAWMCRRFNHRGTGKFFEVWYTYSKWFYNIDLGGSYMLKLEIKLDDDKILTEKKYSAESIYQALEKTFANYQYTIKILLI